MDPVTDPSNAGVILATVDPSPFGIRSFPLVFWVPMKASIVISSIDDAAVAAQFNSISDNLQDWLKMILLDHNHSSNHQVVYLNISGQKNTHVHAAYEPGWWPMTAPYLTATICTRMPVSAADFDAVALALGIPPAVLTGRSMAPPL
jgi:hypothetical protein